MRKLFTILSAVAITIGLGTPAGAATRSSDRKPQPGHAKAQHGDKDRDRHVKDKDHDRKVKDRDHDGDHDRKVKHGDHDGDRDDRHFNDRDRDRDRDHDRDRDRRDFSGHHEHHYHYYHYYYPYYDHDYYNGYDSDRYYYDRYSYGRYYGGRYYGGRYYGGYGHCDDAEPPPGVVAIRCLAFNPPRIHVAVGQQVVWSWEDGATPHTVTADDGSFDSGRRTEGDVRITFNHPGEFSYHCRIHPRMTGSVAIG